MLSLQPDGDLDSVTERMTNAFSAVKTGEITVATRTVEIDGVNVKSGEVIALLDGKLVASASSVEEGCLKLLEKAKADEHELITLFYGQEMPHAEAHRIADEIREKYSDQEIEVQEGGQPHYQFIISVE
jgi:dihydroxyacetone kinase-like predicted kinase